MKPQIQWRCNLRNKLQEGVLFVGVLGIGALLIGIYIRAPSTVISLGILFYLLIIYVTIRN